MSDYRGNLAQRIRNMPLREIAQLMGERTDPATLLSSRKKLEDSRAAFFAFFMQDSADVTGLEQAWRRFIEHGPEWSRKQQERALDAVAPVLSSIEQGKEVTHLVSEAAKAELQRVGRAKHVKYDSLANKTMEMLRSKGYSGVAMIHGSESGARKEGGKVAEILMRYVDRYARERYADELDAYFDEMHRRGL